MWFSLALGSALFFALQGAVAKHLAGRVPALVVAWTNTLFAIPFYLIWIWPKEVPTFHGDFWFWTCLSVAVNLISVPLYFRALEEGALSLVLPLAALTPVFSLFTEFLLLGTRPSPLAVAGVLLIGLGAYGLHLRWIRTGWLAPLKHLSRDRGARRMLLASVLWSVSAVADRAALRHSSPGWYLLAFGVLYSLTMGTWILARHRADLRRSNWTPWLVVVALCGAAMGVCHLSAVAISTATLVISVKRLAGLFGVLIGGTFFQEEDMWSRLAAAGMMVVGAAVIAFG